MEGLKTFRVTVQGWGRYKGWDVKGGGFIIPNSEAEESKLMELVATDQNVIVVPENQIKLKRREDRDQPTGTIKPVETFNLFTIAENEMIQRLSPDSKKLIRDYTRELLKKDFPEKYIEQTKEKVTEIETEPTVTSKMRYVPIPRQALAKMKRDELRAIFEQNHVLWDEEKTKPQLIEILCTFWEEEEKKASLEMVN